MQKRNVASTLKALLDRHGLSPTELHRRTGIPQSTLSRILSEKIVDPSDKHMSKIAEYFGVSTDQLRGRAELGDTREAAPRTEAHAALKDISLWDDDTPVDDDEVSDPFLREVELAAGSGRFVIEESENASLRFGKRSLRHNGVQFDQAKCVTVRGNSMLPVLRDGATVGVNAGKCAIGDIVDGDFTPSTTTANCG
jgi:phage repressor protein C with HTH and peptisase S24 domain